MFFNLFKAKPTLEELIPNGFVDIHSHILPGIDDGAKNILDSKKIIFEMKRLGFSKIITTPHCYPGLYDNNNSSIKDAFNKLIKNMDKKYSISYAAEYMIDNSLIKKAEMKDLLTLKDNYVLLEMSYIFKPINLYDIIFKIRSSGYIPIIAHPERYAFIENDLNEYIKMKKSGCKFQLNLLSIIGYYGIKVMKIAETLIEHNMINFIASDAHNIQNLKKFSEKVKIKNFSKIEKIAESNKIFD